MKKTSSSVPINSAKYAARPLSCTLSSSISRDQVSRGSLSYLSKWNRFPGQMRRVVALLATVLALAGVAGCGGGDAEPGAPKGATLVLDFVPNAAHSGIYAAEAEGFYRDEGVDLKIQPPGESTDAPKLLGAGKVEFAILDIHDLGIDLVGVAPIVQRPLASILARGDGPVHRPRDLQGRSVGVTGLPSDEAIVDSEVEADGGDPAQVKRVTIGFTA